MEKTDVQKMSTKELKQELKDSNELIDIIQCYGRTDLIWNSWLCEELANRQLTK